MRSTTVKGCVEPVPFFFLSLTIEQKSPEAQIMMDHYHTLDPAVERPKILGLTASPIFNVKNPAEALQKIEKLTASKVFVVKQNSEELVRFTFQAQDVVINYRCTPSVFPLYAKPSLWHNLHEKRLLPNDLLFPQKNLTFNGVDTRWYRELKARYESTLSALGPFAADVFLLVHMTSNLNLINENLPPLYPNIEDKYHRVRTAMHQARDVLDRHQERLATDGSLIPNEWLSPKMIALRDLLSKQDPKTLRGMIFVQERQFATTISLILPRLGLPGVRSGPLVGHGQNVCSEPTKVGMKGMSFRAQEHILEDFRKGDINLLIATSVAEEGLDFPECSLVCRFDPPKTLPQYIQSRGRARKENSSFVILLEEGPSLDRGRVENLQLGEAKVKHMYGKRMEDDKEDLEPDIEDASSASEGRFVVEETGASITPAGAIGLLNNLCSLIPRDAHTPPLQPKYIIHPVLHTCVVHLPAALPIPREDLEIRGIPMARTKKAGKRSAAYNAVLRLHHLGVFDQYLLPLRKERGDRAEDIDGKPPIDVSAIEPMMDVLVSDAWGNVWDDDSTPFLHRITAGKRQGMALVCANKLSYFKGEMMASKELLTLEVLPGDPLILEKEQRKHLLNLMDLYTKHGIRYSITRKGLQKPSSVFLVPLNATGNIDWEEMEYCTHTPSSRDWRGMNLSNSPDIFLSLVNETRTSKLVRSRPDLKAQDCVAQDKSLSKMVSNLAKFMDIHLDDDLVLQCRPVTQVISTEFRDAERQKAKGTPNDVFFPQSICQWINFSQTLFEWFALLPPLTSLLCSVFRARAVQSMLNVTTDLNRTIEAFMLPSANASFNNQRLETLGDAFLKLATGIHVFNKYPHKHEGQLSALRQNSVCNRYLLGRGHARSLVKFMTIEPNTQRRWRLNIDKATKVDDEWLVERTIARRSVQDCMEALLGAAWLSGGVSAALQVGTRLDLCFGGEDAWSERYRHNEALVESNSPSPMVEEVLGYRFKDKRLLVEALTHPSFAKGGASYQRLEFLGDGESRLGLKTH
jgi:endoribonuclease Dicer